MRSLFTVLAWVMVGFAVLGGAAEVDSSCKGKSDATALDASLLAAFAAGGLLLMRKVKRMNAAEDAPAALATAMSIEQHILGTARRNRGHVTAVSAAADGGVSIDQAREELERLAKENACLMDVTSDGRVVFRFPEFETPESKPS
jgi:hypothetical protein